MKDYYNLKSFLFRHFEMTSDGSGQVYYRGNVMAWFLSESLHVTVLGTEIAEEVTTVEELKKLI